MWESTPRRWPHILGCTLQDGPSGRSLSVGGILMRGTSSRSQRHPSHILTSHFHLYTPAMPMLLGKDDRRYISYWKSRGPTQPHPTPQTSLILSFIPFRRSIRMTHADNQYLHVQWTLWWWLISTATKDILSCHNHSAVRSQCISYFMLILHVWCIAWSIWIGYINTFGGFLTERW